MLEETYLKYNPKKSRIFIFFNLDLAIQINLDHHLQNHLNQIFNLFINLHYPNFNYYHYFITLFITYFIICGQNYLVLTSNITLVMIKLYLFYPISVLFIVLSFKLINPFITISFSHELNNSIYLKTKQTLTIYISVSLVMIT